MRLSGQCYGDARRLDQRYSGYGDECDARLSAHGDVGVGFDVGTREGHPKSTALAELFKDTQIGERTWDQPVG